MNTMFSSAVLKLTAWYVAVLLLVSLTFSVPLFITTSDRLERSSLRQAEVLQNPDFWLGPDELHDLNIRRQAQLEADRQQLMNNLILENIFILALGAVASYLFARHTLRPIERAHQAQAEFTANASHQLRTPLATMQAEIDVALRDKKMNAVEAREVLKSNLEEIGHLRNLSNQLLALTTSRSADTPAQFDANTLLTQFVGEYKDQFNLVYTGKIKAKTFVRGEEVLIREVLMILCENAARYSNNQSVTLQVKRSRSGISIDVIDKGSGISPSEQEQVFERFYRGKYASRAHPSGHGLGLALARDIVQRFGGSISVKSRLGHGSSFNIILPYV